MDSRGTKHPVGAQPRAAAPPTWIRPERLVKAARTRAGVVPDIQLICGVGPYELDILLREFEASLDVEVVGQVTRAGCIHEPVPELPLALVQVEAASVVNHTHTNAFGEFHLAAERRGPYGLRLGEGPDAPCVLVWEDES